MNPIPLNPISPLLPSAVRDQLMGQVVRHFKKALGALASLLGGRELVCVRHQKLSKSFCAGSVMSDALVSMVHSDGPGVLNGKSSN